MSTALQRQSVFTSANSRKKGENLFLAVASANEQSRNPDGELMVSGLHLENFKKNPVMMFSHRDDEIPVARAERVWAEGTKLMTEFSFLEGDPFADRVRNAWEQGFLNALSVRFLPMKYQGNRVVESELLEISIVSLPADPDALRVRSFGQGQITSAQVKRAIRRLEEEVDRLLLKEYLDKAQQLVRQLER